MKNSLIKFNKNKNKSIYISIIITLIFFILCNLLQITKYEEIDDFMINKLISKADGNYSIYGIYIHPILCAAIMLLYKTGININWYTFVLLLIQTFAIILIGTIFIKKNQKYGIYFFITFLIAFYITLLMQIQYTSIGTLCNIAGFLALIYSDEYIDKKYFALGLIFIVIGAMFRIMTELIAIPFYIVYCIQHYSKEKQSKYLKTIIIMFSAIFLVYISNYLIYNINSKEYTKFNKVRTYLHDYNQLNYNENKKIFEDSNWSKNDRDVFYLYLYADKNFYNTANLNKLATNAKMQSHTISKFFSNIRKYIKNSAQYTKKNCLLQFISLIIFSLIVIISNKKNLKLVVFVWILVFLMNIGFAFLNKLAIRVILSTYLCGSVILIYALLNDNEKTTKNKKDRIFSVVVSVFILMILGMEIINNIYSSKKSMKKIAIIFPIYREVIEYASSNKENVYFYTEYLHRIFCTYPIYEKIPDNTFLNLTSLAGWDTYTKNYYEFNKRNNIDNILTDLYKKDNVYIISGKIERSKESLIYLTKISTFIKEHYNVDVNFEEVKSFHNYISIYKFKKST